MEIKSANSQTYRDPIAKDTASIMTELGYDLKDPSLVDTPDRVSRFLREFVGRREKMPPLTTFPNTKGYNQIILEVNIPFYSMCEHHMVPFFGKAHIGYIPGTRLVGLSKLARTVECFAGGLNVQEGITESIAEYIWFNLEPVGLGVVLEAEHLCMSMRGARVPGTKTITSALKGIFLEDPSTKEEFMNLLNRLTK